MNWIILLLALGLFSCSQASKKTSDLSIANGDQPVLTLDDDVGELPFLIGYRLSENKHQMPNKICSGFRYGYQSIITAASCVEQMLGPIQSSTTRYIQMMSGKPHAFETTVAEVRLHDDWRYRCNDRELRCPDIAIISLPDEFADRDVFRARTDPVRIDRSPGISSGVDMAGYGCIEDDPKNPGGCLQGTSFDDFTFSIGFDFSEETESTLKLVLPSYYTTVKGEKRVDIEGQERTEVAVFPYGISSGDTGAALFRPIAKTDRIHTSDKFKLENGEPQQHVVEGMGIFLDSSFVSDAKSFRYANLVLDLGHPVVFNWLSTALQDDGYNLKGSPATLPKDPPTFGAACNPEDLTLAEEPYQQRSDLDALIGNALPRNEERDHLVGNLNKINHGWSQLVLASCIGYVEKSILDIEVDGTLDQKTRDAKLAPLEYARLLNIMLIEQILAWQEEVTERADIEKELAAAQKELNLTLELAKAGGEAIVGSVPGVALGYDLYLITTGKNMYGESVSTFERGITALTIVVPGFLKAGGKLAAKSAKAVRLATKITKNIEKYKALAGKIGQQVVIAAKRVKDTPAFLGHVYGAAAKFGIKRAEDLRRFARIGRRYVPSCKHLDALAVNPPLPGWQRMLQNSWDAVFPVAYASGMDPTTLECLTRLGEIYERVILSWTRETFEHVILGERIVKDGVTRLVSGMHTPSALKDMLEINAREGVSRRIVPVNSFDASNGFLQLNDTGKAFRVTDESVVLQRVHANGVIQTQLPLSFFMNTKKGKDAMHSIPNAPGLWGVKTLWPESFTPSDVMMYSEAVVDKWRRSGNAVTGVIVGEHNGIKITVRIEEGSEKIRSSYPAWDQ